MRAFKTFISLTLALSTAQAVRAATFSANFNDGQVPAGSAVHGNAVVEPNGGMADSGALKVTKAITSQQGSIVIEDLDAGAPVYGFNASMNVRVGGGTATPADGWSFVFAPDVPDGGWSEEGTGSGLSLVFDTYDNGGGEAPAIDIKVAGQVVAHTNVPISRLLTGAGYTNVNIRLKNDGSLSLDYGGQVIYTNFFIPSYQPIAGGRFGIGARTGGATANHFIDDLQITTLLTPAIGFVSQPESQKVVQGRPATFTAQVSNAENATYQWFRNGAAITGATQPSYTIPSASATDNNATFRVEVRSGTFTITSQDATLTVVNIALPAAERTFDFNSGTVPAGTTLSGGNTDPALAIPAVESAGGVNNSGVLKLTRNENSQEGFFYINDFDNGAPVYGFTAVLDALIGGGTRPPADGWSFNFASDIPDGRFDGAEEGAGTGVTIAFDIFDNGGGEAPSIDVKVGGRTIASKKLPLAAVETGDVFGETIVRMESDGTVDVAFKGNVIHENVQTPFVSVSGGRFVIAARTGGLNENHWYDNIRLTTDNTAGPFRITVPPAGLTNLVGTAATFSVQVSDTNGTTFQWLRNGAPVTGATSSTFTISSTSTTDAGARISVRATRGGVTVTSPEVTLGVLDLAAPANPKLNFTFNDGAVPAGSAVFGNARVQATGGVNDSGVLILTEALNSQSGGFVIQPLEGGAEVSGLTAAFDLRVGGGSNPPADGFSFNFAPDIPEGTVGEAENGAGTGLTVAFDIFDNGGGEGPSIDVRYKGAVQGQVKLPLSELRTGDSFAPVIIRVEQDGTFDLAYNNRIIYNNFQITGWTNIANGKFGFYGRTGGLNENQWVDNLRITTTKPAGPTRFTLQPANTVVIAGRPATFTAQVSDPTGVTYQWFRNGAAISGATGASFTSGALALSDSGARYSVQASGPGGTATSSEAIVTVINPITVSNPEINYNFNDGLTPPGAMDPLGNAIIDTTGGVNNSGVLKLVTAVESQNGSFIVNDFKAGAPVGGFTASWKMLAGGGTATPADGFSFNFASDLPAAPFGEDGAGSGLTVTFDTFDNGGGEAPAVDIKYGGTEVVSKKVPISTLATGSGYVDVVVRLEGDGTLDLIYNNNVIHHNVRLPGYRPISGGMFGWGARTGGLTDNYWVDDILIGTSAELPRITSIQRSGNQVVIQWTGGGTLESAPTVLGPWSPIANSTSPATLPATQNMQFFRVRR